MKRILFLIAVLLCVSRAARAQGTYYIDPAAGSDLWDGTAKTHSSGTVGPWKSEPGMQGNVTCSDNSGNHFSYTHHAGDHFIMKGGATIPPACFGMTLVGGGSSSSVVDYY